MTINFFIRGKSPKFSKIYVRLRDGRTVDQTSRTNFLVLPEAWNSKLELINAFKCPEELDWVKINDAIASLRKHSENLALLRCENVRIDERVDGATEWRGL